MLLPQSSFPSSLLLSPLSPAQEAPLNATRSHHAPTSDLSPRAFLQPATSRSVSQWLCVRPSLFNPISSLVLFPNPLSGTRPLFYAHFQLALWRYTNRICCLSVVNDITESCPVTALPDPLPLSVLAAHEERSGGSDPGAGEGHQLHRELGCAKS